MLAHPLTCLPTRLADVLARYKTMHETLVYLSHLDHDDTEQQMLEKLRLQVPTGAAWLLPAACCAGLAGGASACGVPCTLEAAGHAC